jgi:hypothetical protein
MEQRPSHLKVAEVVMMLVTQPQLVVLVREAVQEISLFWREVSQDKETWVVPEFKTAEGLIGVAVVAVVPAQRVALRPQVLPVLVVVDHQFLGLRQQSQTH